MYHHYYLNVNTILKSHSSMFNHVFTSECNFQPLKSLWYVTQVTSINSVESPLLAWTVSLPFTPMLETFNSEFLIFKVKVRRHKCNLTNKMESLTVNSVDLCEASGGRMSIVTVILQNHRQLMWHCCVAHYKLFVKLYVFGGSSVHSVVMLVWFLWADNDRYP